MNKKELKSYLVGEEGYQVVNKHADMATDPIEVFGILIKENDMALWKQFELTLIEMCDEVKHISLVPYYLSSCLFHQEKNFFQVVNADTILVALRDGKAKYKSQLTEMGLMSDLDRMLDNLKERFLVS